MGTVLARSIPAITLLGLLGMCPPLSSQADTWWVALQAAPVFQASEKWHGLNIGGEYTPEVRLKKGLGGGLGLGAWLTDRWGWEAALFTSDLQGKATIEGWGPLSLNGGETHFFASGLINGNPQGKQYFPYLRVGLGGTHLQEPWSQKSGTVPVFQYHAGLGIQGHFKANLFTSLELRYVYISSKRYGDRTPPETFPNKPDDPTPDPELTASYAGTPLLYADTLAARKEWMFLLGAGYRWGRKPPPSAPAPSLSSLWSSLENSTLPPAVANLSDAEKGMLLKPPKPLSAAPSVEPFPLDAEPASDATPPAAGNISSPDLGPLTKPPGHVIKIELDQAVLHFKNDQAEPNAQGADAVKGIADQLKQFKGAFTLVVSGHTSNIGGRNHNMDLSRRRAKAVARILSKAGLPEASIEIQGHGPDRPIADNTTREGAARNRRVEIDVKVADNSAEKRKVMLPIVD